jgi:hypothetical protein
MQDQGILIIQHPKVYSSFLDNDYHQQAPSKLAQHTTTLYWKPAPPLYITYLLSFKTPSRPPLSFSHGGKRELITQMDCGIEVF